MAQYLCMNVSMNLMFVIYPFRVVFQYLGIVVNWEPWSIFCEAHTLRIYMREYGVYICIPTRDRGLGFTAQTWNR